MKKNLLIIIVVFFGLTASVFAQGTIVLRTSTSNKPIAVAGDVAYYSESSEVKFDIQMSINDDVFLFNILGLEMGKTRLVDGHGSILFRSIPLKNGIYFYAFVFEGKKYLGQLNVQ